MIYWENIEHIFRYRLDMFKITSIVNLDISSDQVFCCPGGSRSPELPQHFSDWGGGRCRDSWHGKRCAWHAIWLQEGRVFFFCRWQLALFEKLGSGFVDDTLGWKHLWALFWYFEIHLEYPLQGHFWRWFSFFRACDMWLFPLEGISFFNF